MTERLIEILTDLVDEDYNFVPSGFRYGDYNNIVFVDEMQIDESRWSDIMLTIVEFDGKLYGIEWSSGATEMQENYFEPDATTVYEVDRKEKVVYTYTKK